MNTVVQQISDAIDDFVQVVVLAKRPLTKAQIKIDAQPAPHKPVGLSKGEAAVYTFWHANECLKIGKAGPGSMPRYVHQHYNGLAPSTLTGSLKAQLQKAHGITLEHSVIGPWMMANLDRVNIIIPYKGNEEVLGLLESFLIARFEPRYEGNRKKLPTNDTLLPKLMRGEVRVKQTMNA